MRKLLRLAALDVRMILREQMLWFMFWVAPLLQFAAVFLLLPILERQFPALADYRLLILLLMTLQVVSSIGAVIAYMLLDEKDEQALMAIRTMPIGINAFLFYRLFMGTTAAFLFAMLMLGATGIASLGWVQILTGAMLFALAAPLVAMALASFAQNKVEGLAVYKVLSLVLLLPATSFLLPATWTAVLGVIPVYWTFHFLAAADAGQPATLELTLALLSHAAAFAGLFWLFRRRVF
jgi:fluoroquinolone transport system permease protein